MKINKKTILCVIFLSSILIISGCSNDDSSNNVSHERIISLQEKNNELLEEKSELQSTISELQKEIGDLREKNGLAKAQFWESYGLLIVSVLFFIMVFFSLWLNYYIKKERAECDEKVKKIESEKDGLKKSLEEQKDTVRKIQLELDQLRKDSDYGERNEVVSLIKRIRESRKNRIELINKNNFKSTKNEEAKE